MIERIERSCHIYIIFSKTKMCYDVIGLIVFTHENIKITLHRSSLELYILFYIQMEFIYMVFQLKLKNGAIYEIRIQF